MSFSLHWCGKYLNFRLLFSCLLISLLKLNTWEHFFKIFFEKSCSCFILALFWRFPVAQPSRSEEHCEGGEKCKSCWQMLPSDRTSIVNQPWCSSHIVFLYTILLLAAGETFKTRRIFQKNIFFDLLLKSVLISTKLFCQYHVKTACIIHVPEYPLGKFLESILKWISRSYMHIGNYGGHKLANLCNWLKK